jgi:hypothetical protein
MPIRPELFFLPMFFLIVNAIPILVGFIWIRADADHSGQPGILWAVLTIPFGWLALLVYLVVRAVRLASPQR